MKYNFHNGNLKEELFKINGIDESSLDISRFDNYKKDEESILCFKEKLLSLKDSKFLIVGDYDCDGICATAITKRLLDNLSISNNFYIPSRIKDGYGLNKNMVDVAIKNNFDCILTVDNGVVATEAINYANENDIKVLIIDHHNYQDKPNCFAFIHPDLLKDGFNKLSAGGLSYLLSTYFYVDDLSLCYGGLTILSDMVGVLDFNRYLLVRMMEILSKKDIYQLRLLNDSNNFSYDSLSFNVIPKINSISRMNYNPNFLVKYLLADEKQCDSYISQINNVNNLRKKETNDEMLIADKLLNKNDKFIIVISDSFKEGICGLLANKISSTYKKPCLVFCKSNGLLKGSGRSPEDVELYDYLSEYKGLYETFGGHGQACGLSIKEEKIDEFLKNINSNEIKAKRIVKDVICFNQNELNSSLLDEIESLKPFGIDFKEPLICVKDFNYSKIFMIKNMYPKYIVNNSLSAICFKGIIKEEFNDLIGHISKDNYHKNAISILIEDLI